MPGSGSGLPFPLPEDTLAETPGSGSGVPAVGQSGFVTLEEVKEHLAIEMDVTAPDAAIMPRIGAASYEIERECARRFRLLVGHTRTVFPNVKGSLYVTDFHAEPFPTVYVDSGQNRLYETLVDPADYELLPYPEDEFGLALYQEIAYIGGRNFFDPCIPVRVTGNCGWVDSFGRAPEGIRLATLMLMARWWKRRETPAIVMQMPAMGFRQMIQKDQDIIDLLEPFVHQRKKKRPVR